MDFIALHAVHALSFAFLVTGAAYFVYLNLK